jgi:hypothetical protein
MGTRRSAARAADPGRVFLGLTEIAGYYRDLRDGFASSGIEADVVTLFPHAFGYEVTNEDPHVRRMIARVRRVFPERPQRRTPAVIVREVSLRIWLLAWALPRYDTFVFGFRNTFLGGWDLPLLRLFGKRIVCVLHGSDARPAYVDRQNGDGLDGEAMARWVRRRRRLIRRMERWSHELVAGALTLQLHSRPVVSFQVLGVPTAITSGERRTGRTPYRVVHAPSHLATKGTTHIRAAIEELRQEGIDVDYRELVGVPNEEVLAALADADLLVDQLYSDTFLGGLGAEAAGAGCPAIVAGYELDRLDDLVPNEWRPPGYYCAPADVTSTIRAALTDDDDRRRVAAEAQSFVAERWSNADVAERLRRVCVGDVPAAWRADPMTVVAVHGCGVDETTARAWIGEVVMAAGPSGLGVDDKPRLREAFLALARGDEGESGRRLPEGGDPVRPAR